MTRTRKTIKQQIADANMDAPTMQRLRDEQGRSWEDIAKKTGLTNAGSAKEVYRQLVGVDPSGTIAGNKAPRGSRSSSAAMLPEWDNDTDTDDITEAILGRTIFVDRGLTEPDQIAVKAVMYYDTETPSGKPMDLTVTVIDAYTKSWRSAYVSRILQVR